MLAFLCVASQLMATTAFPSRTDFRDEQIYFVMTTRFYDGDPANNTYCWDNKTKNLGDPEWRGDFKGLIEKLDYIKALGFTAIWITPVVENLSGYDYHGYHASNFSSVDKRYESEDVNLKTLIDAVHARGMKIIIDIVLNHCGNFGEENLCKLFNRDWTADQSDINAALIPYTVSEGGKLPNNYSSLAAGSQYAARLSKMKNTANENGQKLNNDNHNYWHHYGYPDAADGNEWDSPCRWFTQIAGDCVDLNTENSHVSNYLVRCYTQFIALGCDGFRIDTGGHISRLTFNKNFIPQFQAAAQQYASLRNGFPFYMFAEVCARYSSIWYRDDPSLSPLYYTWKENRNYAWDTTEASWDNIVALEGDMCRTHTNHLSCRQQGYVDDKVGTQSQQRTSQNALLNGNVYHTPDYSQASGLNVIDFTMHWNFGTMSGAYSVANKDNDKYYNDATWNVVYVDSHDYGPGTDNRYDGGTAAWAENLDLMYTFRGIPCLYYGSEIEFQKGVQMDKGTLIALRESGRAYFGGYLKGSVNTTDFAEYNGATGNLAATLSHPLAQHIQRLSKIRMAVPALRKGQYSKDNISGSCAFKRRYTDASTDSYVLVTISGNATFNNILNGTYVDCVTGDTKTVTNGTLSVSCSGKGNMRVYVLNTALTPAPGKIGADGKFLFGASAASIPNPTWDGTQEELTDDVPGQGGEGGGAGDTPATPCLETANENCAFFVKEAGSSWGSAINCYIWNSTGNAGGWPGNRATALGGGVYKYVIPAGFTPTIIIWNDGSNQTNDLTFTNRGLYAGTDRNNIAYRETVSLLCEDVPITAVDNVNSNGLYFYCQNNAIFAVSESARAITVYGIDGRKVASAQLGVGTTWVATLPFGLYICEGQKIINQ